MNDVQLDDLKQLIITTVGAAETRIKSELTTSLTAVIAKSTDELRHEMREGFAAVGAPISNLNDQVDNHETRLTKLESKAA